MKPISDEALLVLGEIRGDVRSIRTTVDLVVNEQRRLGQEFTQLAGRVDTVEQQIAVHPPRQRMVTEDEITSPGTKVGQSIRAIQQTTADGRKENRWLTLGIGVVILATTALNQCPQRFVAPVAPQEQHHDERPIP